MKAEELAEVARKKLKGVAKEIAKVAVSKYCIEFFDPAIKVDAASERNKGYFISPTLQGPRTRMKVFKNLKFGVNDVIAIISDGKVVESLRN